MANVYTFVAGGSSFYMSFSEVGGYMGVVFLGTLFNFGFGGGGFVDSVICGTIDNLNIFIQS